MSFLELGLPHLRLVLGGAVLGLVEDGIRFLASLFLKETEELRAIEESET